MRHLVESRLPRDGLSYVRGPSEPPLRFITVPQLLNETVLRHGARDAVYFPDDRVRWSWHDLQRHSDDVAAGLLALGINRGDRVALWAPNCPQALLTLVGAAHIGAVLVTIDPGCHTDELAHVLTRTHARLLIMASEYSLRDPVAVLQSISPELPQGQRGQALNLEALPALEHIVTIGSRLALPSILRFEDFTRLAGSAQRTRLDNAAPHVEPDDALVVQFNRDTSPQEKGVSRSHYSLINNACLTAPAVGLSDRDRLCVCVPMHDYAGMTLGALACMSTGATMVFPAPLFDAGATLHTLSTTRCTAVLATAHAFTAVLDHERVRNHDLTGLRTAVMVSLSRSSDVALRLLNELHLKMVAIPFGATVDSPAPPAASTPTTFGQAQPHLELKVVDDQGRMLPVGQPGELWIRGYLATPGGGVDESGWLYAGEQAMMNEKGGIEVKVRTDVGVFAMGLLGAS
ncbi:MAG: AMP-binding protein [Betaproteobacteria bacterium]|nr:AMP-binding protein [Betaproteobacteria bacterium]